jgi:hypothetical protein
MNWLIKLFGRKKHYDFDELNKIVYAWIKK